MKDNIVRQRVKEGKPAIGCFLGLGSPNVAELMARAGMDWLVIETEHNGLDSAEIQQMLMAMNGSDSVPIVRVPNRDQVYIQRALDMGAMGVLVPGVRTANEARAIVSYTRFPPVGVRSWGPLRASDYTLDNDDYLERANENILVCLILETSDAVENLEEICEVPGVDVLTIGPWGPFARARAGSAQAAVAGDRGDNPERARNSATARGGDRCIRRHAGRTARAAAAGLHLHTVRARLQPVRERGQRRPQRL